MIGILLIIAVGKVFYTLAVENGKNKWVFAIAGVLSYYVGIFVGGFIMGAILEIIETNYIDEFSDMQLGLMAIPLGVAACWGFYKFLQSKWRKSLPADNVEILDGNLME